MLSHHHPAKTDLLQTTDTFSVVRNAEKLRDYIRTMDSSDDEQYVCQTIALQALAVVFGFDFVEPLNEKLHADIHSGVDTLNDLCDIKYSNPSEYANFINQRASDIINCCETKWVEVTFDNVGKLPKSTGLFVFENLIVFGIKFSISNRNIGGVCIFRIDGIDKVGYLIHDPISKCHCWANHDFTEVIADSSVSILRSK